MSLLEQLSSQLSGPAIEALSGQLGTDKSTTSSAISAALPMIIGAMAKNASNQDGAASLANALEKDHDGSILNNLTGFLGSSDNGAGPAILGHVFGQKQTNVEQGISKMSGIDAGTAGKLLQNLAPVVMGMLSQQKKSQGLDVSGLAGMLMGEKQNANSGMAGAAMGMLGNILDQDGDGSFLDDIGGMLGKFMK